MLKGPEVGCLFHVVSASAVWKEQALAFDHTFSLCLLVHLRRLVSTAEQGLA